ncbi:MAG: serine/threonine-protein kinase [Planctomycetota bacterium]
MERDREVPRQEAGLPLPDRDRVPRGARGRPQVPHQARAAEEVDRQPLPDPPQGGRGGNSEVFEAEDLIEGGSVALKIVKAGSSDWDEETLVNEADRALNHDNIAKITDFGLFESRPALVMEFIPGGTVADLVKDYGEDGLPESAFFRIVIDVCKGLHHAHQANIVHRDVKPENMLRTLDGRIKMADFGIAKRFESSETGDVGSRNTVMAKGTAPYMSPEQCDLEGRVDRRADVYSLGCVMYEMLTGKPPFTEGILLLQHLQNDPPPLLVKGDYKNPDEICHIVERCMKKRKDERYQSMKELAQDIVRVSKLQPQKKTHKAVVMDTGADTLGSEQRRGGTSTNDAVPVPMPPANRGMKIALVVMPLLLVLAVAGFFAFREKPVDPGPAPDPNRGNGEVVVDPALEKARTLAEEIDALVKKDDLAALAAIDVSPLEGENVQSARDQALASLRDYRSPRLQVKGFADPAALVAHGEFVGRLGAVVAGIDPDDTFAKEAAAYAAAAAKAPAAIVREKGLARLDEAWLAEMEGQRDFLKRVFCDPFILSEFADGQRTAVLRENVRGVAARLAEAATSETGLDEATRATVASVVGDLRRNALRLEEMPGLLEAARAYCVARLERATTLDELVTVANRDLQPILSLAPRPPASVFDLLDLARSRLTDEGEKAKPGEFDEAAALAVAAQVAGPGFRDALASRFDAADPSTWKASLDALVKLGFTAPRFAEEYAAVLGRLATPELSSRLSQDIRSDAKKVDAVQRSVNGVLSEVPRLPADLRTRLSDLVPRFEGSVDKLVAELRGAVGAYADRDLAAADVKELGALLERLRAFAASPENEFNPARGEFVKFAQDALRRCDEAGRPLAVLFLAQRGGSLAGDTTSFVQRAARRYLDDVVKADAIARASYFGPGSSARANHAWSQSSENVIVLDFRLPEVDRALLIDDRIATFAMEDGSTINLRDGMLHVETSPRQAFFADGKGAGDVAVRFRVGLGADGRELASVTPVLAPADAPNFDVEVPRFRPGSVRLNAEGALELAVEDNLAIEEAPRVRLGGQALEPRALGEGKYRCDLALADVAAARKAGTPRITVELSDAFGNAAAVASVDVSDAYSVLVQRERDGVRRDLEEALDGLTTTTGPGGLSGVPAVLDRMRSRLQGLRTHDTAAAAREAESAVARLTARFRSWLAGEPRGKELESRRDTLMAAIRATEEFARAGGATAANLGSLRGEFDDLAAATDPTPGDPTPVIPTPVIPTPVTPTPTGPKYNEVAINVAGVNFLFVKDGRAPCWLAEVEMSAGFAKANAPSAARRVSPENPSDAVPLVPIRPSDAEALIDELNSRFASQLAANGEWGKKAGVALEFAVPTFDQWKTAGEMNGEGQYVIKGVSGSAVPTALKSLRNLGKGEKWASRLLPVDEAYPGLFRGLAGNAWEMVKQFSSSKMCGGSIALLTERNDAKDLRVKKLAEAVSSTSPNELLGLRLSLQPK